MANLFWGVSDAFDLYGEYLQVLKKVEKETTPKKPVTQVTEKANEMESQEANEDLEENKDNISIKDVQDEDKKEIEAEANEKKLTENQALENDDENNAKTEAATPNNKDSKVATTEATLDNYKIGAGDANSCKSLETNNKDDLQVENVIKPKQATSLEMNFNPILEQSPPNLDDETNVDIAAEPQAHKQPTVNILIFGGGDPRHVIKTMAKRYSHLKDEGNACSAPILKFYVLDGCVEIIARNMVLLGIALERPELISLRNKVHLFMDVYGNTLLRPICHQYLVSKSATLLKMVSDKTVLAKMAPFINLDNLKYRERDGLQDTLEFWSPKPGYDFNIKDYWMARLRRLLAVRYDCRDGVFDWDLNMSLKSRGAQQICSQEYKYWRETGIAFTFPEYEQSKPNKTLAAGLVRNGSRYVHRGYIGDIQTGPFCTFGLRSEEERLHRSAHGENDFRATEVTERNLLEYFYELQNGAPYEHNNEMSQKYGGVRFHMGERLVYDENDLKGICAYDQPWISVEGVEVHFLSAAEAKPLAKAAGQWDDFFDVVFVGYKYFELLEDSFTRILRKNGLLILETKLRSTEIKSRITEFEAELSSFAREAQLEPAINYNALNMQNSILKFIKN